jgi:CheY-like chemotaxis protein
MKRHILLIEDNEQNRYLTTFLLEKHGYRVTSAATGPAGVELARELLPDLILLDVQLPGMDGYAVATALKADARTSGIPIVVVTSYAMAGDREKVLATGAEGYLEKPIDPETFVGDVERYLVAGGST